MAQQLPLAEAGEERVLLYVVELLSLRNPFLQLLELHRLALLVQGQSPYAQCEVGLNVEFRYVRVLQLAEVVVVVGVLLDEVYELLFGKSL